MIALAARLLGHWYSLAPAGYCAHYPPGVSVRHERICGMDLAWQQLAAKLFVASLLTGFLGGLLFAWAWGVGRLWGGLLAERMRDRYQRHRWYAALRNAGKQENGQPLPNEAK